MSDIFWACYSFVSEFALEEVNTVVFWIDRHDGAIKVLRVDEGTVQKHFLRFITTLPFALYNRQSLICHKR